jgi:mannose-6-phosphate isomerase class I
MKEIIFLEPVFHSMIWGGNKLATDFGFNIPNEHTGECWAISAHKNGDCLIKNGKYRGQTLSWLWDNHREEFGDSEGKEFPLLVKIIDANKDLSVQVHPDDEYARVNENAAFGKTECWYILDCDDDGEIVIGHNAQDKQELKSMIQDNQWQKLLRVRKIKKGEFFQIEPGTVHAIKKGTVLLETQQNSDITYRLYDYDRLDHGKPRQLHIEQSIDVIRCPHLDAAVSVEDNIVDVNYEQQELVHCGYYTVQKLNIHGKQEFIQDKKFLDFSVISGNGSIDGNELKKGDSFILPYGYGSYQLAGNMELIISFT